MPVYGELYFALRLKHDAPHWHAALYTNRYTRADRYLDTDNQGKFRLTAHSKMPTNAGKVMTPAAQHQETPIAKAAALVNAGKLSAAESILKILIGDTPDHAIALYLLGLIAAEQHHWADAENHLRRAIRHAPKQSKIYALLARVLRAEKRPGEALTLCLSAPEQNAELKLELARCHEAAGALEAAAVAYRTALLDDPSADAALCVSQFLCRMACPVEAESVLRPFLPEKSNADTGVQSLLRQQLGVTLKLQKRHNEALREFETASHPGGRDRSIVLEHAGLLAQLGRFEDAAKTYEDFLQTQPLDMDVHALLNEIYWILGRFEQVGASYDKAFRLTRGAVQLPAAKGRLLMKLGKIDEARAAFETSLGIVPGDALALASFAQCLEKTEKFGAAREVHEKNISTNPADGGAWEAFGQFLLLHDDPRLAVKALHKAVRTNPANQSRLATLGLAYRACGDEREQWLNDYDRDVQVFDLPPPEGYRNMESFNAELSGYLLGLHAEGRQYMSQTLRGGTQTYDGIFYRGHQLIDLLLVRINAAIQTYREKLVGRAEHPFASRLGRNFRHIGSWSSCLQSDGYHVNHIHQKGWISSCYYASLPGVISEGQQGWLKFGEPPAEFGLGWLPRKLIQPRVGRLVLFPSYLWHGTQTFHADQQRITIAFDTVPA